MLIDAINRLVVRSVYGAGFRAPPRQAAEMIFGKSIAVVEFQAAKSPHALLHESSPPGYRSSLDKLDSPQFGATSRNLAQFRAIVSKVVFLR